MQQVDFLFRKILGIDEAVAGSLQGIGNHLAGVKIVATGVGPVTESDVMRAKASEGKASFPGLDVV